MAINESAPDPRFRKIGSDSRDNARKGGDLK
jgi:hypothetical protein